MSEGPIRRIIDLAILPTSGILFVNGRWEPNESGKIRIQRLVSLFKDGAITAVAIIGGKSIGETPGWANIYFDYLVEICPEMRETIKIVDASATNTNRDIEAAMPKILAYLESVGLNKCTATTVIVSYKNHAERAMITLRFLGFSNVVVAIDEEKQAYFSPLEWILKLITRQDPLWKGPVGRVLNNKSEQNVRKESTRE